MDRYLVVSSDCHAGLPPEQYRAYLDPQYRDAFDVALPIQIELTQAAAKRFLVADINDDWRKGREDLLTGAWDHEQRLRVLDGDGVAAEVIFPDGITEMNMPPFGAGLSMPTENIAPELQWAGARSHNRWLAELCQMAPERHIGVAIVPALWDVEEAVREVEWARTNGLQGIMLPVQWGKLSPYHHPKYDPLWAACQDHEMVIHFHSGPAPIEDYFGKMDAPPEEREDLPGAMGIYISEVAFYLVRPLTFMMWGGVFERFPRLKVVLTEGTSIWVPEYLALLDQRYSNTHYSAKLGDYHSHLKMKPSEYFARNVAVGASCMPRREAELRHEIGIEQIMWGSDYPHPEGSWPYTPDQMHETFHGLPENEIAAMLGGNAVRFYGLDAEKLAPHVARIGPEKARFR
ncbi:MAG: amidohydrolase [Deltaproteobacteria bacterium]|nr:amidohydrolase [Deltaproteobacteria bacterium]MBW2394980.1 amidohydrolase [Deltaproteobacteria bacterium]